MMKPYAIQSIQELHALLELPKPKHQLISVIDFSLIKCFDDDTLLSVTYGFYCIALKKNFKGQMRYGQQNFDFDDGIMTFFAPNQVVTTEIKDDWELKGVWLVVHPDFIQGFPLSKEIHHFDYFSYNVNEALHLSVDEEEKISSLLGYIKQESEMPIDNFVHPILIKQIELLLNYCDRFYNRQFLTRKQGESNHLSSFEVLLNEYYIDNKIPNRSLPSVSFFADKLNLSANYLSDMLRSTTGKSAQQHIQLKLIDKAKELLSSSNLSINEIAYQLGFEHPQSFSKLFKNKTKKTPKEFRASFS